jgi:hypothetical protein
MKGKALLYSKTFWVNVLALIGMVLTGTGVIASPDWVQYEAVALAAVNVVLRLVTGRPIEGIVILPENKTA